MMLLIYKGNPLLALRTMFLWWLPLLALLLFAMPGGHYNNELPFIAIAIYILLLLWNARYAYYFCISDDTLQIRNHFMFWHRKSFLLKDINSIRIDTKSPKGNSKQTWPTFLRIYTTPLDYETFYACTLKSRHWCAVQKRLMDLNIRFISTMPPYEIKFSDLL